MVSYLLGWSPSKEFLQMPGKFVLALAGSLGPQQWAYPYGCSNALNMSGFSQDEIPGSSNQKTGLLSPSIRSLTTREETRN